MHLPIIIHAVKFERAVKLTEEYEAQRTALAHEVAMVAKCELVLRKDDERPVLVATWTPVITLLPIVDVVVLAGGDAADAANAWRFAVAWRVLEARVGATCWRDAKLAPPRVRTHAWPAPAVLRELWDARDDLLDATALPPP
jgi:hypothetical protein